MSFAEIDYLMRLQCAEASRKTCWSSPLWDIYMFIFASNRQGHTICTIAQGTTFVIDFQIPSKKENPPSGGVVMSSTKTYAAASLAFENIERMLSAP